MNLKPFEAKKLEFFSQRQYEWFMQLLPKLNAGKKTYKSVWIEGHYYEKVLLRNAHAPLVVIGDSIDHRRYPVVWRTFSLRYSASNRKIKETELKMFYGALKI